ncbi:hypothetical protein GZL_01659 [Streptomyces sp. 769]|nr:hypothetical protein GZL_01659 [Streptomyces sp. 769]
MEATFTRVGLATGRKKLEPPSTLTCATITVVLPSHEPRPDHGHLTDITSSHSVAEDS